MRFSFHSSHNMFHYNMMAYYGNNSNIMDNSMDSYRSESPNSQLRWTPSPASSVRTSPPPTPTDLIPASSLAFSIDNILRPDFSRSISVVNSGIKSEPVEVDINTTPVKSEPLLQEEETLKTQSSSPKTNNPAAEIDIPVDLSKTSNEAPKTDASCPPGMVRGPNGQLWPAWVFCTRYSDRPSSGPRIRLVVRTNVTDDGRME